jgi:hypothetical protein
VPRPPGAAPLPAGAARPSARNGGTGRVASPPVAAIGWRRSSRRWPVRARLPATSAGDVLVAQGASESSRATLACSTTRSACGVDS